MKRLKNTNIRSIIVLVILFALLICMISAGIFIYKNRNSIMALYYTYTNKVDVLEQSKQNTDEKAMDAIKEFGVETVRPLTEEEEKAPSLISSTVEGKVNSLTDLLSKACSPIIFKPSFNVIFDNCES